MLYHVISYHPTLCLYIYICILGDYSGVSRRQPKMQFVQANYLILEFRGEWTSLRHADVFIDVHIYIYIHIQCLLLSLVDWCMIYWWVYKHLIFTLNPSSNTCKTYITISLSQPVVVCRKWSCMLPMPKNWVQHKNAWPSLIGFGGCHLSSASHVEE